MKVLEINANLVENDFWVKEINAEDRETFQNKGNLPDVYKETKLLKTTGLKLNLKSEMDTLFLALPLNVRSVQGKNSGRFKFYTVSLQLPKLHPDKRYSSFLGVKNVTKFWEIGVKIMEIKAMEIDVNIN